MKNFIDLDRRRRLPLGLFVGGRSFRRAVFLCLPPEKTRVTMGDDTDTLMGQKGPANTTATGIDYFSFLFFVLSSAQCELVRPYANLSELLSVRYVCQRSTGSKSE